MKRSEKLLKTARHELAMALMFLSAAIAAGVWAVATLQSGNVSGGTALVAGAAIALFLSLAHSRETIRLARLSNIEARWEWERGIRPRI